MTEAELMELAHSSWAHFEQYLSFSIGLLSGYLVAAYLAGATMSRFQAVTINLLYMSLQIVFIFAMFKWMSQAMEAARLAAEITTQREHRPAGFFVNYLALGIVTTCVLASLVFMGQIRHTKPQ